jgi:putative membrane protein
MAPFIDYVPITLFNAMVGYFLLAGYLLKGLDDPDQRRWAVGFGMVGAIALLFGVNMALTWPLPGPYGSIYGDMSSLLGIILLGAAVAMALGWRLETVAGYAFFAGLAAMITGVRFIVSGMTTHPVPSGIGFILSGLAGVMALPTLRFFRHNQVFRVLSAVVLSAAGLIWAVTVYTEYWTHPLSPIFHNWVPR